MRTKLLVAVLAAAAVGPTAFGQGMMIPEDRTVPLMTQTVHRVGVEIVDQVAVTTVEQTFRNPTSRPLEATYLFPVPAGASVNKFSMWIDGKEQAGELLDAKKAAQVYTDIVRRTQDPGLLEYVGRGVLRMRVFPVPAHGDQRVKLSYTAILPKDGDAVEYTYPLKTDARFGRGLTEFDVRLVIKSERPVQTVYSPTHAVAVSRRSDREVAVQFERTQAVLDKDFQLFFGVGGQDIGLTTLLHKPVTADPGHFLMLLSPVVESAKAVRVPRDIVMVVDTSGSMAGVKLEQAKKALKFCLQRLDPKDRFAIVRFATTVQAYKDELTPASMENLERAASWVTDLQTSGGTAILPALNSSLNLRSTDAGRTQTILFFTDGLPTVDETNPDRIVKAVVNQNSANTRIFTFGVGDDVNASMLDQLADATRAVSTYVRPEEDIESKVASLHAKITHPVMTNLKLTASGVQLGETYPPRLPDLFHGGQVIVAGKYTGHGPAVVKLTGQVGGETKEIVYEISFPEKTDDGKQFVEQLWARRKVGFLLDQIRANGEQKELVAEVTALAKKYGIATPYTSYLVVPDGPMPVVGRTNFRAYSAPPALGGRGMVGGGAGGPPAKVEDAAKKAASSAPPGGVGQSRGAAQEAELADELRRLPPDQRNGAYARALKEADEKSKQLDTAGKNFNKGDYRFNQTGKLGVDLAVEGGNLRNQSRLSQTASKVVQGRNCVEVGGVWIDDKFDAKMPTVVVRSQGTAYFRILEKKPEMKDVFVLGNHIVWVAPNGSALVIDQNDGQDKVEDAEIDKLFVAKK